MTSTLPFIFYLHDAWKVMNIPHLVQVAKWVGMSGISGQYRFMQDTYGGNINVGDL